MDVGRIALLSQGFEIVSDTGSELHAHGPGMHSNQQPPLMGVTDFIIQVGSSTVTTTATLGGVARMKAFLYLFPLGLALLLGIFGAISEMEKSWGALLFALPWLFLSPWLAISLENKTIEAVDALTRGMAHAGAHR